MVEPRREGAVPPGGPVIGLDAGTPPGDGAPSSEGPVAAEPTAQVPQAPARWPVARAIELTKEHIPRRLHDELVRPYVMQIARLTASLAEVMSSHQRFVEKTAHLAKDGSDGLERLNAKLANPLKEVPPDKEKMTNAR